MDRETRAGLETSGDAGIQERQAGSPGSVQRPSRWGPEVDALPRLDTFYDLDVDALGGGGMGTVYRAFRISDGTELAAKQVHYNIEHPTILRRFLVEAETTVLCRGPGVIRVEDFGTFEGIPTLVLELCPMSLLDLSRTHADCRLPVGVAVPYFLDVLEALETVHERGIIHRDVKPSNLLVGADGRARLCDFGIARNPEHRHTLAEAKVGTPGYAEPRALADQSLLSPDYDLFSTGLTLAALTTPELRTPTLMDAEARKIALIRVDGRIRPVVARATHPDPESRYPSARAMREDLLFIFRGWGRSPEEDEASSYLDAR